MLTAAATWVVVLAVVAGVEAAIARTRRRHAADPRPQVPADDRHLVELLVAGVVTPDDLLFPRGASREATRPHLTRSAA